MINFDLVSEECKFLRSLNERRKTVKLANFSIPRFQIRKIENNETDLSISDPPTSARSILAISTKRDCHRSANLPLIA